MKNILRIIFILIAVLFVAALCFTIFNGFDASLSSILSVLGKSDKQEKALKLLTPQRFFYVQITLGFFAVLCFFISAKIELICSYLKKFVFYSWQSVKSVFADLKSWKALVLLIPVFSSVYFGINIPVTIDEASTYINFSEKAFYVPLIYYPAPNNHILHSALANLSSYLPFLDPLFALRLPAILSSILLWIVGFSFVKRFYSEKVAMFVIGLVSMIFVSVYYSYTSRGYALMMLMFMIGLYSICSIIRYGSKTKYWMFFGISTVLGLYTIPTYIYPFLSLNVVLLIYKFREIKQIIKVNLLAGLFTFLLYLPIFLLNDMSAAASTATDNPDVSPFISHLEFVQLLPSFLVKIQDFIFGISVYVTILLLGISLILLVKNKRKTELVILSVFYLLPLLLHLIYPVIPLERTFIYLGFITIWILGVSLSKYLNKMQGWLLLCLILPVQLLAFFSFKHKVPIYEGANTYAKEVNDLILEEGKTYYFVHTFYMNNLIFEMKAKGYDYEEMLYCNRDVTEASADTIFNYDYVLIEHAADRTKFRQPFYSGKYQNVYKK